MVQYQALDAIAFRKLDEDCVAFSGFSGETVLLHPLSFRILNLLSTEPYTFSRLSGFIRNELAEDETPEDISGFLDTMLLDLVNRGFVHTVQ